MQALDMQVMAIIRAEHGDADSDDDDDEGDVSPFYHPVDYVFMTWHEKRNHGLLPEPGGLNDQDWRLVYHDWPLVNQRFNELSELLYPSDGSEGERYQPVQLPPTKKNMTGLLD